MPAANDLLCQRSGTVNVLHVDCAVASLIFIYAPSKGRIFTLMQLRNENIIFQKNKKFKSLGDMWLTWRGCTVVSFARLVFTF